MSIYPTQLAVLKQAFERGEYQIYVASYQARPADLGNIHVAKRFDFRTLLSQVLAFINHGGQNSILSAIMSGVPQIVFPGNVFNASGIRQALKEIQQQASYVENIRRIKCQLMKLGGVDQAIQGISSLCSKSKFV